MKCELCGTELSPEQCVFAQRTTIDGKEYACCCARCVKRLKKR